MDEKQIGTEVNEVTPFKPEAAIIALDVNPLEVFNERHMTKEEFEKSIKLAAKLTSYIGGASESVDEYLGKPIEIIGAIQHPCTIVDDDGVEHPDMRTVFRRAGGKNLSFVSKAATSFFNNCLKPFFGVGDYPYPVTICVTQSTKGDKRNYNFIVVSL